MTSAHENDRVSKIFRMASESQSIPEIGHFTEDEEFLTCWSLGILSPDQQREMIDHLADCPQCRSELAAMLKEGVITPPEATDEAIPEEDAEDSAQTPGPTTIPLSSVQPSSQSSRRAPVWKTWGSLAAAASILIAAYFIAKSSVSKSPLDDAARQLAQGNALSAFSLVEEYLDQNDNLDASSRTRAEQLYRQAAGKLAPAALADGQFERVLNIENRVASRVGAVPELLSLKLQAERGETHEHTLARAGSLTDYGYQLDGETYTMCLPDFDKTTERLKKEFARAVAEYPENVVLRLNYAQLLLDQGQTEEACGQFADALSKEGNNPLAHLGMGLAQFRSKEYEPALKHFETVVALDPGNVAGHLNTAICLTRLGRPDEARVYWRDAQRLTKDSSLRKRIEQQSAQEDNSN